MHEHVTYNRYYETFKDFTEAIKHFFRHISKKKTVLRARITDIDGDTGTARDDITIGSAMVDIKNSFTFNPSPAPRKLLADMGVCSPDGVDILIEADPVASMIPSSATCKCNAGLIDCSAVDVVVNDQDFTLSQL